MTHRAVVVHGFASTFDGTWGEAGWSLLLADLGLEVIAFELPGHGSSSLPGNATTDDTVAALLEVGRGADIALGFSAGSLLLLRAAVAEPDAFRRLALLGIGEGMWRNAEGMSKLAEDLLSDSDDSGIKLLQSMALNVGNSLERIAEYAGADSGPPAFADLAAVVVPTLIVLGDRDEVGPAGELLHVLPRARLAMLQDVDHYRTPSAPSAMNAVLDFLKE